MRVELRQSNVLVFSHLVPPTSQTSTHTLLPPTNHSHTLCTSSTIFIFIFLVTMSDATDGV
jgi:hypothetical protein